MNVLVCDDERQIVDSIIETLEKKTEETQVSSRFYGFSQPSQIDLSLPYDIALLDIDMGETNGIELARKLRAENENIVIIFITNFIQYAPEGFEVQAFRYLLKADLLLNLIPTLIQLSKKYFGGNSLSQFQSTLKLSMYL